jgi:FkbM family methyltransferase
MNFFNLFETVLKHVYENEMPLGNEMERVAMAVKGKGAIALYPCNRYSRKLISYFMDHHPDLAKRITAVFDKSDNINFRNDVKVLPLGDLPKESVDVLIVTTSKFPADLLQDICDTGFPLDRMVMTSLFREELSHFTYGEIRKNVEDVLSVLSDAKSKNTYLLTWLSMLLLDKDILSIYSGSADLGYNPDGVMDFCGMTLHHIYEKNIQQSLNLEIYKMEHVYPEPGDIVIDAGAYRGDTAALFRKYTGETGVIYAFEPDEKNHGYLVDNVKRNNAANIVPVKKALMADKSVCNLIATPESGSFLYVVKDRLDTDSFNEIQATTLDGFMVQENLPRIDFIKSDIEGSELEMLEGAANTLKNHKPKLALAIYHSITDLMKIPLKVKEMNPGYEVYIRHIDISVGPWEIIMFAR